MSELRTVVWKEWREHFLRRGRPSRTLVAALILVTVFGFIVPVVVANAAGRFLPPADVARVLALVGLGAAAFQGLVVTTSLIIDAFAGERERHTLETLLAGPLSDRAILLGKVAAIQLFVAASALAEVLAQQTIAFAVLGTHGFAYTPVLLAGPLAAVAVGLFVSGVGAIIGMRVATVKNGQQLLAYILLPLYLLPTVGSPIVEALGLGPAIRDYIALAGPELAILTALALLAALDAALLTVAIRSFRRDRLLHRRG